MKLGEFVIGIVVDAAKGSLAVGDLVSRFSKLEVSSLASIGSLGIFADAIEQMSVQSMNTVISLDNFSAATGLNTETLQRWQSVGRGAGVSAETMASTIQNLQLQMTQFKQFGVGPFAGISTFLTSLNVPFNKSSMKDAYSFMTEMHKLAGIMRPDQFSMMLGKLGMVNMAGVFKEPMSEFDLLYSHIAFLTDKQKVALKAEHDQILLMQTTWERVGHTIAYEVSPWVVKAGENAGIFVGDVEKLAKHSGTFRDAMVVAGLAITFAVAPLAALAAAVALLSANWKEVKAFWLDFSKTGPEMAKGILSKLSPDYNVPILSSEALAANVRNRASDTSTPPQSVTNVNVHAAPGVDIFSKIDKKINQDVIKHASYQRQNIVAPTDKQ